LAELLEAGSATKEKTLPMQNDLAKTSPDGNASAKDFRSGRWVPILVTLFTIAIFVGAILFVMGQVRSRLHEGYLAVDGEVLLAAIRAADRTNPSADAPNDRLGQLLQVSDFRDEVWGIRLFDSEGKFIIAFPKDLKPQDLSAAEMAKLSSGRAAGYFEPRMKFASQFLNPDTSEITVGKYTGAGPVLRSTLPIGSGAAEFLLSGERVEGELLAVDEYVRRYSLWVGVVGSLVIGMALAWAFWRLKHANTLLRKRTGDLLRANHELTLAAKTSAVGAVAAHLIHGLKNPLFGLQMFVSHKMESKDEGTQLEWRAAADAAQRMQMMIADIVRILREDTGEQYEVSVGEVVGILEAKITPMAREKSVEFSAAAKNSSGKLPNRESNLVILALTNLIQNAIQASKAGGKVSLQVYRSGESFRFDVSDEAGGIPPKMREKLFTPCASTKPGGTGLGLAITKQLANHMGGQLEMVETNNVGTTFRLSIPQTLFHAPTAGEAKLSNAAA
jgi:signal transduction histidine kinase